MLLFVFIGVFLALDHPNCLREDSNHALNLSSTLSSACDILQACPNDNDCGQFFVTCIEWKVRYDSNEMCQNSNVNTNVLTSFQTPEKEEERQQQQPLELQCVLSTTQPTIYRDGDIFTRRKDYHNPQSNLFNVMLSPRQFMVLLCAVNF